VTKHTSIAPTPETQLGLMMLPEYMAPNTKGQKLIIVLVGTEKCLIPESPDFKSNQKTGECHRELNSNNYMRRIKKNTSEFIIKCMFLIDNAAYHRVLSEMCATSESGKKRGEWLSQHNIPFSSDLLV
jgi:hypothetical protein